MDVIIEIFLDFFCEVYFDLLENLLPDKNISKRSKIFLKILALVINIGAIICGVFGVMILTDKYGRSKNLIEGIIFVIIAVIIVGTNIGLGIFNAKKKADKKTIDDYLAEKKEDEEKK
ncbi:MAG: hypothetical protein HFE31_01245 [Clostridia bacterium]|nr:hypothetical protein [Clostridia bacterium]